MIEEIADEGAYTRCKEPAMRVANRRRIRGLVLLATLMAFAVRASGQGVGFAQKDYPTGSGPTSVITADLNGDGKQDLAVANSASNNVSVLLGNGDGTFAAKTDFTTGMGPRWVTAGDFNADSKLDLITANFDSNTVSLLLGNGDGTFAAASSFPAGNGPVSAAAADFNADRRLDLAVANQNADTISVLLGNGDGTFAAKADFVTGAQPSWLIVADFNGDTKLDLASANPGSNTVSVLRGNGDGTFAAKADFAAGTFPRAAVAADFRRMLRFDVATANKNADSVSILLGRGDGTFDPRIDLGTDTGPLAVTSADFDNDGNPDLLTTNAGYTGFGYDYPTLSLLRGRGDGTFFPRADFDIGTSPQSVATADFNGDGRTDVVTANRGFGSVSVFLQSPAINISHDFLTFPGQQVGTTSPPQTLTVASSGSFDLAIGTVAITGANPAEFIKVGDTCSASVFPSGSNCQIQVAFSPSTAGEQQATLSIPTNAPGSSQAVPLVGGRNEFSIGASSTSATVTAGQTATFNLVYNSTFSGAIAQTCYGAPPRSTCTISPTTVNLTPGDSASSRLDVATTRGAFLVPAPRNMPPLPPGALFWLATLLASALPFAWLARGRAGPLRPRWALVSLAVIVLALPGCNNGAQPTPITGTPPGSYAITVTASGGGTTRTITLDLRVN